MSPAPSNFEEKKPRRKCWAKCLITGVNGFVGSYLAEYLFKKNTEVTGTVYPKDSVQNLANIADKIQTFPCNLSSRKEIENIIKKAEPELIFHLAGQGYVPISWEDPISTFNVNVLGTLYLLEEIRRFSPKTKILIIGSGDEYGSISGSRPLTENTPLNPQNPYAVTKVCIDLMGAQLAKYYKLHIVRVRPFPHIGPRQSPNFVVSDFCRQIALIEKHKEPPIIRVGNLESKRDFTDVRDMVHAYWLAMEKGLPGEVYNISSGKAYSIGEILKKLINMSNAEIKIELDQTKLRPQDTHIKLGNSHKFRKLTGWEPKIPIKETLQETLDWWRKEV